MITVSDNGLAFLKSQEGFHPSPTRNYKGVLVIGYGHVIDDNVNRPQGGHEHLRINQITASNDDDNWRSRNKFGMTDGVGITEEEASILLLSDLVMPIKEVRQAMQFVQLHSFFGNRMPDPKIRTSERPNIHNYSWLRSFRAIQNRFDALLSIRFTMTFAEFKATDMMRSIYDGAQDATILHHLNRLVYIDDPNNPGQRIRSDYLVTRRQQEATLFFSN